MVRVGTCKDCGTRYKVPEATRATRARCKKCGGTIEIPPATGVDTPAAAAPTPKTDRAADTPSRAAAPSKRSAAPSRAAPAKGGAPAKPPARSKDGALGKSSSAGKGQLAARRGSASAGPKRSAAAKAGPRGKGSRTAGGKGRAGRGAGSESDAKAKSPMKLILTITLVLVGGRGAAWLFWPTGDESANDTSTAEAGSDDSAADGAADDAAAPVVIDGATMPVPMPGTDMDGMGTNELAAAPEAKAPPAATKTANEPAQPVDPVIAFEPLPPNPGITQAQHDEWAALITSYYLESPGVRQAKAMRVELALIDPVDAAPAYINALIGLDMRDAIDVRDAFKLVDDWMEKEADKLHFYFPDASRMEEKDISDRAKVAVAWRKAWAAKQTDEALIEKFRLAVEVKRADDAASGR
jgi:hypothetical protein